jgi:hypothetical protein
MSSSSEKCLLLILALAGLLIIVSTAREREKNDRIKEATALGNRAITFLEKHVIITRN